MMKPVFIDFTIFVTNVGGICTSNIPELFIPLVSYIRHSIE